MAKDYFQDILPPQGAPLPKATPFQQPASDHDDSSDEISAPEVAPGARSIRNISVTPRAPRRPSPDMRESLGVPPPTRRIRKGWWVWLAAAVSIAILGLLVLVALRPTTVRVVPRSHAVVFDSSMQFNAYPAKSAATGTLQYIVNTTDLDDSAVVPAQGTEIVSEKATGSVTVVNNYSATKVVLLKNTRFQTPDGLIFRISSEVSIPGRSATKPGELTLQVTADQPGEKYNVGPIARFTLPGLQSTPDMYANVYARSTKAMAGGFVGERHAVAPATLEAAKAAIRERIEGQVRTAAQNQTNPEFIVLPDLVRITYTSLPSTKEDETNVRIHEKAHVEIPAFPAGLFAEALAREVSADAESGAVMLENIEQLTARVAGSDTDTAFGSGPLNFTLEGSAKLVWNVDLVALAEALAGREEAAFQAIVAAFPGVEEAYARIQPFWKNSFPKDPSDIQVRLEELKPVGN